MWVSTFAVSALASNFERMGKPFNPLLGETYELKRPDFRIVCEQVSMIDLSQPNRGPRTVHPGLAKMTGYPISGTEEAFKIFLTQANIFFNG